MIGHLLWGLFAVAAIGAALLTGWGIRCEIGARRCWDGCMCRTWRHTVLIERADKSATLSAQAIADSKRMLASLPKPRRARRRRAR